MTLHIPFQGNTTRSHKEYLFLFYPTVQIIFVFSKSTDAHPRQDVLPDKFKSIYIEIKMVDSFVMTENVFEFEFQTDVPSVYSNAIFI